jgi:hypothetical protein
LPGGFFRANTPQRGVVKGVVTEQASFVGQNKERSLRRFAPRDDNKKQWQKQKQKQNLKTKANAKPEAKKNPGPKENDIKTRA